MAVPRVIITTDIGGDPDDEQSLVRYLLYAHAFDTEGIIAVSSASQKFLLKPELIRERIEAYGRVHDNLQAHVQHKSAPLNRYPTADELMSVVKKGNIHPDQWGMAVVGPAHRSEGSDWIIRVLEKPDPRPVWILLWGGANTVAQALQDIRLSDRTPEEKQALYDKVRIYAVFDQDDANGWIRETFPDLFYIRNRHAFFAISGDRDLITGDTIHGDPAWVSGAWFEEHVRSQGPLGALYTERIYIYEGDTPSFLHLLPVGLRSDEDPTWGGWGGRFERVAGPHLYYDRTVRDRVMDHTGVWRNDRYATQWRWRAAFQRDFKARMQWTLTSDFNAVNHPPEVRLSHPVDLEGVAGDVLTLDASPSVDPDGHALKWNWFVYEEAGSYRGPVALENNGDPVAQLVLPAVTAPQTLHVVVEVTDDGEPPLTRYQRVIVTVLPAL